MVNDRPAENTDRVVDSTPPSRANIETPPTSTEFNNAVFATRPTDAPTAGPLSTLLPSSAGDVLSPRGKSSDCSLTHSSASPANQPSRNETRAAASPADVPATPQAPTQEHVIHLRVASTVGNDTQYKIEGSPAPVAPKPAVAEGSDRHSGPIAVPGDSAGRPQPNGTAWDAGQQMPGGKQPKIDGQPTRPEAQAQEQQPSGPQQQGDRRPGAAPRPTPTPESSQEQKQTVPNPHQNQNFFAMLFQTRRRKA